MRLDVGSYIVKKRRMHFSSNHILRVKMMKGDKYFQLDAGIPFVVSKDDEIMELERFKIIKKLSKKIEYRRCKIDVSFYDEDRHEFTFTALNEAAFERIKKQFPRLWMNSDF